MAKAPTPESPYSPSDNVSYTLDYNDLSRTITHGTTSAQESVNPEYLKLYNVGTNINMQSLQNFTQALSAGEMSARDMKEHQVHLMNTLTAWTSSGHGDAQNALHTYENGTSSMRTFVAKCASIPGWDHNQAEKIAAIACLAIIDGKSQEQIKTEVDQARAEYTKSCEAQSLADIGRNGMIYDDGQHIVSISTAEHMDALVQSQALTGEQKGFMMTLWNQGKFTGSAIGPTLTASSNIAASSNIDHAADASRHCSSIIQKDGKTFAVVSNATRVRDSDSGKRTSFGTMSTIVDITDLKADTFTIGAASAHVPVRFVFDTTEPGAAALEIPQTIAKQDVHSTDRELITRNQAYTTECARNLSTHDIGGCVQNLSIDDLSDAGVHELSTLIMQNSPVMRVKNNADATYRDVFAAEVFDYTIAQKKTQSLASFVQAIDLCPDDNQTAQSLRTKFHDAAVRAIADNDEKMIGRLLTAAKDAPSAQKDLTTLLSSQPEMLAQYANNHPWLKACIVQERSPQVKKQRNPFLKAFAIAKNKVQDAVSPNKVDAQESDPLMHTVKNDDAVFELTRAFSIVDQVVLADHAGELRTVSATTLAQHVMNAGDEKAVQHLVHIATLSGSEHLQDAVVSSCTGSTTHSSQEQLHAVGRAISAQDTHGEQKVNFVHQVLLNIADDELKTAFFDGLRDMQGKAVIAESTQGSFLHAITQLENKTLTRTSNTTTSSTTPTTPSPLSNQSITSADLRQSPRTPTQYTPEQVQVVESIRHQQHANITYTSTQTIADTR